LRSSKRRLALVAALAATALIATACAPSSPTTAPTPSGPVDPNATLTVGLVLEPDNLDIVHTGGAALEQVLINNIYEGLVTRTETGEVVPRLASAFDVTPDGLIYTFTLRDNVTFHSGKAMTAADALASLRAVQTDELHVDRRSFAGVSSIESPDANTIVITLAAPDQNFLFTLTGRAGLVFEAGDTTDMRTAANGTGPFTFVRWSQGNSLTFARNSSYWGELAGVREVVLQYIPDFTAGVNAALDGTLDVLTAVDANLASQLDNVAGFSLTHGRTTDTATLAFNNQRAPLNDVRVREALRLAIDHEALILAIGGGDLLYGPIPEVDPGYEDLSELAPYNPERAKQLLAEAGHDDLELTLTIPAFYGTTIPRVLVSDFAKVGVTLKVDSVEFPTWLDKVYTNKDYDLSYVLHVEARDFNNYANPNYYFGYNNVLVQSLYAQAMNEVDPDRSAEKLREAARLVSKDHAADWLYNGVTITAVGAHVQNFPKDSINSRIDLSRVTVLSD
jgi:peptide/nickel transport system substrate-binding protein